MKRQVKFCLGGGINEIRNVYLCRLLSTNMHFLKVGNKHMSMTEKFGQHFEMVLNRCVFILEQSCSQN